jgi:hypothetical protein
MITASAASFRVGFVLQNLPRSGQAMNRGSGKQTLKTLHVQYRKHLLLNHQDAVVKMP